MIHKALDSPNRVTPAGIRQSWITRTRSSIPRCPVESHLPGCPVLSVQGNFHIGSLSHAVRKASIHSVKYVLLVETARWTSLLRELDCDICVWDAVSEWTWRRRGRPSAFVLISVKPGLTYLRFSRLSPLKVVPDKHLSTLLVNTLVNSLVNSLDNSLDNSLVTPDQQHIHYILSTTNPCAIHDQLAIA